MPIEPSDTDAKQLMQQFGQFLIQAMAYAQRDVNVLRAQQGQSLAPGTTFGPPADIDSLPSPDASTPIPSPPVAVPPQADLPASPIADTPVLKDETWAEHYKVPTRSRDEMQRLRDRVVQEAARRQRAISVDLLSSSPDPFSLPTPQDIPPPKEPPPAPQPTPQPAPQPQSVVRSEPVPSSSDDWGNWQSTQVDNTKVTGTDNTQPNSTKTGENLRNQLDRMNSNLDRLFKELTDGIVKLNQRVEQVEARFEAATGING